MTKIKGPSKQLNIKLDRVVNPPQINFGFQYLQEVSWVDCKRADFFKEFLLRLSKLSTMTWQNIYQSPRHGFGTEKLQVKSVKPSFKSIPEDIDNFLVIRATGDNRPFLGFRNDDTFEVVFIESEFGDIYRH